MNSGYIFVLDGPAAAGKTHFAEQLVKDKELTLCPRMTTREPRKGDPEYTYVSESTFEEMRKRDEFASYRVFPTGTSYGVSKKQVEEILARGENPVIIVDLGTADQVKDVWPRACTIFLIAPLEHIESRLHSLGLSEQQVSEKMQTAANSFSLAPYYDYVLPNRDGDQDKVYQQLRRIVEETLAQG